MSLIQMICKYWHIKVVQEKNYAHATSDKECAGASGDSREISRQERDKSDICLLLKLINSAEQNALICKSLDCWEIRNAYKTRTWDFSSDNELMLLAINIINDVGDVDNCFVRATTVIMMLEATPKPLMVVITTMFME